jgi:hypothetical protein
LGKIPSEEGSHVAYPQKVLGEKKVTWISHVAYPEGGFFRE